MAKQFVFFYLMEDEPERIRNVVPAHVAYWEAARVDRSMGGPFGDRSGGLITFEAEDLADAAEIVEHLS